MFPVEHRFSPVADGLQLPNWEQRSTGPIEKIGLLLAFQEKRRPVDGERINDVFGDDIQQLEHVFAEPQLLTERIESLDFAPALVCICGATACAFRELAGHYRGNQEGKERYPVLRIGNRKSEQRRQKEIVVSYCGKNGCENCVAQAPGGGDQQNG